MAKVSLYPPNPENVPDDLTEPSAEYRTQTMMLLFSLALFFMLYFGLMFFSAMYVVWAFWFFFLAGANPLLKLMAMMFVPLAMILFVYMLKNLFKSERAEKEFQIEIFEDEHPKLFEFIHQLCEDVGVDPPLHVYVEYYATAYAIPDRSSFFHLFIPTGRSLCIGLGLVNMINLTEFKALLAHEFGHFSQSGTRIRVYARTAFEIVDRILNGEDWFDRWIFAWSQGPPVLNWPAYIIRGILWILKKAMKLLSYVIYFFHNSFGRQREFHADSVAVALTGSDAPVYLLHRCYIGEYSFHQAVNDLKSAMSQHLFTSDLFYHQSASVKVVRKRNKGKDLHLEEPPELPSNPNEINQLFDDDDDDDKLAEMWASHPSNCDREQNAKAHYIRSVFDYRSPWALFDNVEELRERITYKFYRFYFKIPKDVILADPVEVQGFIDDEHADRTYDPKYQGLYDFRNLLLGDIGELARDGSKQPWSITELAETHATLYNAEVKHRSQLYYKRVEEKNMLVAVFNGWQKPKNDEIEFRGDTYEIDDAKRLLKKVEKEIEKDHHWIKAHDLRVFMTYFQMALHINQEVAEELYRRYAFHMDLQNIWYELQKQNEPIQSAIAFLDGVNGPIQQHHFRELLSIFRDAHKCMKKMLTQSKDMTLPALKNMPAGQTLRPFLLEKNLLEGLSKYDNSITHRWIVKLLDQFREMKEKVDRIHFKSLAGILGLQEKIGDECTRRWSKLPAVKPL